MTAVQILLFKIILEILSYSFMQMYTLMSTHIVRFTRIDKEIRLRSGSNACLYEGNNESRISETTVTTTTTAINGPAGSEAATVCANGHSIIVKSSSDCVVSVYSASGEAITTPAYVKAGTEASFTVKSAGLYIVKTETSEKTSTDKIIIK